MIKKDDGTFSFKAASEDFPQKHKGVIINVGIAETGQGTPVIKSSSTKWDEHRLIKLTLDLNSNCIFCFQANL